jgi:hypothetical protein
MRSRLFRWSEVLSEQDFELDNGLLDRIEVGAAPMARRKVFPFPCDRLLGRDASGRTEPPRLLHRAGDADLKLKVAATNWQLSPAATPATTRRVSQENRLPITGQPSRHLGLQLCWSGNTQSIQSEMISL